MVDASVLCALLFDEPEAQAAGQLLLGRELHAPRLLDHEVLNVAVTKVRRGLAAAAAQRALADYLEQPLTLTDPALDEQLELALRYRLSGYDAAYLWLAASLRAPLLTFDERLGEAAAAHLKTLE